MLAWILLVILVADSLTRARLPPALSAFRKVRRHIDISVYRRFSALKSEKNKAEKTPHQQEESLGLSCRVHLKARIYLRCINRP